MSESSRTSTPSCPRCNYDQTGIIESWHDACPLTGTCSECGLEFSWADLLSGKLAPPPWWSVERDSSKWFLKIPLHWFAMFFPRRAWTGVRMEHPIRGWRLFTLALVSMVVAHFALSSVVAYARWSDWGKGEDLRPYFADLLWPYSDIVHNAIGTVAYTDEIFLFLGLVLATQIVISPLVLWVLPDTRSGAKVHRNHVARITAYTIALTPAASIVGMLFEGLIGGQVWYLSLIGTTVVLAIWWYSIATRYVRLHLAWIVVASIVIISTLAMPIVLGVFFAVMELL